MTSHFLAIPEELQIKILSCLDGVSVTLCAMACKSLNEMVKSSSQLQCIVELHLDGLVLAPPTPNVDYPRTIERLLHQRQAWMALDWGKTSAIQINGIWTTFNSGSGALAGLNVDTKHYEIVYLSTIDNANIRPNIQRDLPDISAREIAMDMSQDLIVLLEDLTYIEPQSQEQCHSIRLHLHSISSDGIHQLAQHSPLEIIPFRRDTPRGCVYNIQIVGKVVVVQFNSYFESGANHGTRLYLWNWNTSDLIFDSSLSNSLNFPLSPTTMPGLEYSLMNTSLLVQTSFEDSGCIRLFQIMHSPIAQSVVVHVATLHLPKVLPTTQVLMIFTETGAREACPLLYTNFMQNDEDRLHSFMVVYGYSDDANAPTQLTELIVFVHQRCLLRYAAQPPPAEDLPRDIPWEDWGPQNTRIIRSYHINRKRSGYIQGQRALFAERVLRTNVDELHTPSSTLVVFDFSLASAISFKQSLLPPSRILTSDVKIFEHDVETRLPCVSLTKDIGKAFDGLMMYGGGIIGINPTEDDVLSFDIFPV
ncbi:hypothetical protein BDN70DRAFT_878543 [Pholiota conissans]|uniref:F-box domain-containing protein n=1 Tax=Pholiota conissans TaxID=109636 RepID=A0A9P5Z3N0_9AGAR|nr:hypothetical protein BDN70DRAFT_878543 [Pholiota conissans]